MEILISDGKTFVKEDGSPYIGPYYIDNYNFAYIYNPDSPIQVQLINSKIYYTELIRGKMKVKGGYSVPRPIIPDLKNFNPSTNTVDRFFCQKRIHPELTITEIDGYQFYNIDHSLNGDSPNLVLYNKTQLEWMIEGNSDFVKKFNRDQIISAELSFKGLSRILTDLLQYYRG